MSPPAGSEGNYRSALLLFMGYDVAAGLSVARLRAKLTQLDPYHRDAVVVLVCVLCLRVEDVEQAV